MQIHTHWLLQRDMLPRLQRRNRDLSVQEVRQKNLDRVYIGVGQHLSIVLI